MLRLKSVKWLLFSFIPSFSSFCFLRETSRSHRQEREVCHLLEDGAGPDRVLHQGVPQEVQEGDVRAAEPLPQRRRPRRWPPCPVRLRSRGRPRRVLRIRSRRSTDLMAGREGMMIRGFSFSDMAEDDLRAISCSCWGSPETCPRSICYDLRLHLRLTSAKKKMLVYVWFLFLFTADIFGKNNKKVHLRKEPDSRLCSLNVGAVLVGVAPIGTLRFSGETVLIVRTFSQRDCDGCSCAFVIVDFSLWFEWQVGFRDIYRLSIFLACSENRDPIRTAVSNLHVCLAWTFLSVSGIRNRL